jgi:hypothetical protein
MYVYQLCSYVCIPVHMYVPIVFICMYTDVLICMYNVCMQGYNACMLDIYIYIYIYIYIIVHVYTLT